MYDERERFLIRYARGFASFIVARANGAWIETTDGRRILDFTSGQICSTIGHNHPRIVAAVQQSLEEVIHLNSWMLSEPVLALAERLVGLAPASLNTVILVNTGGEANEIALRLAKMHTGRFEIVGLTRSWHGLQAGAASLNLAGGHAGYGPLMPGSLTLPAPYAYRCPIRHCSGTCDCSCLESGFDLIDQQSVGSLCAVIAEPVLSAGGIIVPPPDYFQRLRKRCEERGMLLMYQWCVGDKRNSARAWLAARTTWAISHSARLANASGVKEIASAATTCPSGAKMGAAIQHVSFENSSQSML